MKIGNRIRAAVTCAVLGLGGCGAVPPDATITSDADDYAAKVAERLRHAGLTVELDLRNEKINYKVREHSLTKVPVILVCGKREAEEATVSMRRLGSRDQESLPLDVAVARLAEEAVPPDLRRKSLHAAA